MKNVYTKEEYYKLFKVKSRDKEVLKEALKTALDTRKFEIELYWKRATYFWTFIAATFTGYFLLLNSEKIENNKGFTVLISFVGLFFSLGWYYVNRGSKYWQKNWEEHVYYLEDKIHGPLFKTSLYPNHKFWSIDSEYTFSVSRINQTLSLMIFIFWGFLYVYSILFTFDKLVCIDIVSEYPDMFIPGLLFLITLCLLIIFTYSCQSFHKKRSKIKKRNALFKKI